MKRPKLSRTIKRQAQREAAEEFFRNNRRQLAQVRPLEPPPEVDVRPAVPMTESGLPPTGSVLDIDQSKEILKRLASGELKQRR